MEVYTLPKLPYAYDALEPFIDEKTMRVHHDGHHRAYVEKLNETLKDYPKYQRPVEQLLASIDTFPLEIRDKVRNNAGGHANHSLFWTILSTDTQAKPQGELSQVIDDNFGGFSEFKTKFTQAAADHFSNGWAWLTSDADGKLSVFTTKDHESPLSRGLTPLLVLDLWEHAYYLKYQNHKSDYFETFWEIVDWKEVGLRWSDVRAKGATTREWRMAS